MKRRAFLRRMAFAAIASAFIDVERLMPQVESATFTAEHIVDLLASLESHGHGPQEFIMHQSVYAELMVNRPKRLGA